MTASDPPLSRDPPLPDGASLPGSAPGLSAEALSLFRSGRAVLRACSFTLGAETPVAVLGANGAGKTSLLRVLLGLERPASGTVRLGGRALTELSRPMRARAMAYVPQYREKPPGFTVFQIVAQGRFPHGGLYRALSPRDRDEVEAALDIMTLSALRDRPCNTLSGGEYQRVLLARAVAQKTDILVLDEPLAALDYGHQRRFMALLSALAREGRLVIMTIHQPDLAFRHARRILLMQDGRLVADGPPERVLDSATLGAFWGVPLRHHDIGRDRFYTDPEEIR
ncbi:ABC transporter ATP-binding protein [Swaminathania salitolerans]|uniref:Iron(III) ABC transporter ATP-binding protein n=1 Tax=Swaminathania salitolerans TaxID=182838 RepID=A0A511BQ23_9PROT|nr:ABC transporter ATP-binding protein [Swaminathania salitolerans]GBQ11304.1 ferrichrome ABC transporter ATP-binding protein [Swaminathania salitolerans LMG 21291]GEL02420.1 iron(III) ABC transporter ATP-binding protein [Swaminathania salitolerans]